MKKAFTLIELLVVIAIIAILAAILFPVFAQAKAAAKASASLSNHKQLGLGQLQYCADYDDIFPLMGRLEQNGVWPNTWHDMAQPYMKNLEIQLDPLFPTQTNQTSAEGRRAYFSQPMGSPVRATAVAGNTNDFFFTGSPSWDHLTNGQVVRFDGILGAATASTVTSGGTWLVRFPAGTAIPSLSQSQIENISDQVLIAGAGNYDMWFMNGKVAAGTTANYCNSGWGLDGRAMVVGSLNITGPHARKTPIDGTGNYTSGGGCFRPNGQSLFTAADGSTKSMNLRRVWEVRQAGSQPVFYRFWPRGGTN